MTDSFIAQTLTIANHPLRRMGRDVRLQYVLGLGELLHFVSGKDPVTQSVFEIWSRSILKEALPDSWRFWFLSRINKALLHDRDDFRAEALRKALLFDCFYILEKSKPSAMINARQFLSALVRGCFQLKTLEYVYGYFQGMHNGQGLSVNLRQHRNADLAFKKSPIKRVLVVATMSAGKSTLINALVGEKVNKVQVTACTSKARCIYNAPRQEGASVVSKGRLSYTTDTTVMQAESSETLAIGFRSLLKDARICLIDTPGVNYHGDATHGAITRKLISENNYDILLFVSNAQQFAINDERDLLEFTLKMCKRKMVFALNQCDSFSAKDDSIEETVDIFDEMIAKISKKHYPIVPTSGLGAFTIREAERLGEGRMDEDALFDYKQMKKKFSRPFYDFPSCMHPDWKEYVVDHTLLDKTGITTLENIISSL